MFDSFIKRKLAADPRVMVAQGMNILSLAIALAKQTLLCAMLILVFLFYTASPETTVFGLSQVLHRKGIWILSSSFTFIYWVTFGIKRTVWLPAMESRQVTGSAMGAAAGSSFQAPAEKE